MRYVNADQSAGCLLVVSVKLYTMIVYLGKVKVSTI